MSKHRRPYRAPFVLEIGEPKGDTPEAVADREEFRERARRLQQEAHGQEARMQLDKRLDEIMRRNWEDPAYWAQHGMSPPLRRYPGLEEIRRITGV